MHVGNCPCGSSVSTANKRPVDRGDGDEKGMENKGGRGGGIFDMEMIGMLRKACG